MKSNQPNPPQAPPDPAMPLALRGGPLAHAAVADPLPIEALESQIDELQSKNSALAKRQMEARELFKACDQYIRSIGGFYDPTQSAERNISRASRHPSQGKAQFSKDHDAFLVASEESHQLGEDVNKATRELREVLRIEGAKHDAKILEAHAVMVSEIAKYLLPVCVDDKEAKAVARGLVNPTRLHRRLNSWQHRDVLISARHFVTELRGNL